MSARILLVEDDPNLGASLTEYVRRESFDVECVSSLAGARQSVALRIPDLILLDWMLADGQGIDLLMEFKGSARERIPVILLTSRTELVDRVLGLESGALDYVTKPFEPRELVARIRAQLRGRLAPQGSPDSSEAVIAGPVRIFPSTRTVSYRGQEVSMTKMEFELLSLLCGNPNRVFSREELLNKVWGYERFPTTRTIDTHVLQLRQKLSDELLETVRGVGYRFKI